jgi:hypothetical protein
MLYPEAEWPGRISGLLEKQIAANGFSALA